MADQQPSITSILAALAAQRPNPTPTPTQPPPQAYQPPPQQTNPYGPSAGYALPQPINSGSLDLSSIKPVNSGTVSITDAIAKAKAIAAEKGLSYDRPPPSYNAPDPRLAGSRPYRSSRSRSPQPRRDGFRENFNPYRDERRGVDRGPVSRDYRERSFSPGPRGRGPPGTFSPPHGGAYAAPRGRTPPRGDDNVESISIESSLVGLIIGKQGENLRRVEEETGCRVQFITGHDDTNPYRECKITGTRANRARAKARINQCIDDSGMAVNARGAGGRGREAPVVQGSSHQPALRDGEDSMQIMVPDRTVGLIIGRGGETIRDLQERSGCHVNIVGEQKSINGLRPVNLIGSQEAAAKAKEMIMEIVESDSRGAGATADKNRAPAQKDQYRDSGNQGGGEKIDDSIFVPSEAVGMIIGKGGETIKDIQSTTGCKINVSPKQAGEVDREIGLVGSREAIAAAKRAIEDKVEAVAAKNGGGGNRQGRSQNDYSERSYSQSAYSQPQQSQAATPAQAAPATGGDDPYAAYGGYQNYVALWYQAIAAQQGGQPQDPSKPPGTS